MLGLIGISTKNWIDWAYPPDVPLRCPIKTWESMFSICDGTSCPIRTTYIHAYKLKHFVPLRCVVSVKRCFVGHRRSLEEVFLYFKKWYQIATRLQYVWIYSLLPAGLFKPNLNFELIMSLNTEIVKNENIVLLREEKMKANSTQCSQVVTHPSTDSASLHWSDENWCVQHDMAVGKGTWS